MNGLLLDKCAAYARAHKHLELADQTIWQVFETERSRLVPMNYPGLENVLANFMVPSLD